MLNILQKNEIFNVLVVVTRYFGGTLLGTGGLVRAYSDATLKGIENAGIGLQKYGYVMNVTIEYKDLERFKYYCRKNEISIIDIIYEKEIMCQIELTKEKKEELIDENQKDVKMLEYAILKEKYIKTML